VSNDGSGGWRRFRRFLVALALGVTAVSIAAGVAVGLPRGWAPIRRTAWAAALGVAAVFLLVNAFWGLIDVAFPDPGPRRPPTAAQRVGVFFGGVAIMFSAAIAMVRWQQVPAEPAVLGAWGALILLASSGRPWLLFATVRERGVVALASGDRYARLILASLGLLLIGVAVLIPR